MRLFRMYLKDECLRETTLHNATIIIKDCLGENKVEKVLQKLFEGITITLKSNWTMKEII